MATGDIKNNLKKLQGSLKTIKYEKDIDIESISKGIATSYLPIYHYLFIDYSRHLSEKISEINIELQGKSDLRFIEAVYKVLRELFTYKPPITKDQFFSKSFGERKVIMTTEIINMVAKKHKSLAPKPRVKVNLSMNSTAPVNSSKLGTRATSAPIYSSLQDSKKTDTKSSKSKPQNIIPVLPQVVNEMLDPSINTQAAATLAMAPPANEPALPNLKEVRAYKPASYACGPGPQIESQETSVEIVSLQSGVEDSEHSEQSTSGNPVRPIDIVKTPGRPLVESHRNKPPYNNLQSSPLQYTAAQQNPDQHKPMISDIQHLSQIISTINDKVLDIEGRIAAMEGLFSMQIQQEKQKEITPQQIENLTARLTLLENRITLHENKKSLGTPSAPKSSLYQPSAYQSEPLTISAQETTEKQYISTSSKPNTPERPFEQQCSNGHDSPDKENKMPQVQQQQSGGEAFSDSLENVSPISLAIHSNTMQSTGTPDSNIVPTATQNFKVVQQCSTPTDNAGFQNDNGTTASKYEQAERIKNMLKNTEDMLNIQVVKPMPNE